MRILLVLALIATLALALFPNLADQTLRIEALGWVFETRQGAFVIALLLLLFVLALTRRLLHAIGAGPGRIWQLLTLSGRKREAKRLQQALADMINLRGDQGRRALRRRFRTLPDWMNALLRVLATPRTALKPDPDAPLVTALAARLASEPSAKDELPLEQRRVLVQAWLSAYPDAPLARMRMAELLEEEEQWADAADAWESLLRDDVAPRAYAIEHLTRCLEHMAHGERASVALHRALKWQPERSELILRLGQAYLAEQQPEAARKLWWQAIQRHEDFAMARALLPLLREDALRHYKRLNAILRRHTPNRALLWLKAELALTAGMDGVANEVLNQLAEQQQCADAWLSLARMHAARGEHAEACRCYEQALDIEHKMG